MRSRASVKPSDYPTLPFHVIRGLIVLSAIVVSIILAVFIFHLHADGYKLPFAFLILLISAFLSLVTTLLTTIINWAWGLSPKFSLLLQIPLLLLWILSLALLSYSMSGTILTKCTTQYWVTSAALSVCRTYKALFTFTAVGTAGYIAAVWLDVIVRHRQTRLGAYGPMGSSAALGEDPWDVKLADRRGSSGEGVSEQRRGTRVARGQVGEDYRHPAEQTGYDPAAYR